MPAEQTMPPPETLAAARNEMTLVQDILRIMKKTHCLQEPDGTPVSEEKLDRAEGLADELRDKMARVLGPDVEMHRLVLMVLVGDVLGKVCRSPAKLDDDVVKMMHGVRRRGTLAALRQIHEEDEIVLGAYDGRHRR